MMRETPRSKPDQGSIAKSDPVETLRTRIAILKEKIVAQRREISNLKKELYAYRKREYGDDIDPIEHNTQSSMNHFFSLIDDTDPYIIFADAVKIVLDENNIALSGRSILDWGVGPGIALQRIIGKSVPKSVTGFDTSEVALRYAESLLPYGNFFMHDLYTPCPRKYDIVFCTEVLEHLVSPEIALHNLYKSVASDGDIFISVPDGRIDYSRFHINFWSPESWSVFLKRELPEARIVTGTFRPYPERAHRNNFAIIRRGTLPSSLS